jgi:hypothetical protein
MNINTRNDGLMAIYCLFMVSLLHLGYDPSFNALSILTYIIAIVYVIAGFLVINICCGVNKQPIIDALPHYSTEGSLRSLTLSKLNVFEFICMCCGVYFIFNGFDYLAMCICSWFIISKILKYMIDDFLIQRLVAKGVIDVELPTE